MTQASSYPHLPYDLVPQLLLEAGRLMEDYSPLLAMQLADDLVARSNFLATIQQVTTTLHTLINAAIDLNELANLHQQPGSGQG